MSKKLTHPPDFITALLMVNYTIAANNYFAVSRLLMQFDDAACAVTINNAADDDALCRF